MSINLNRLTKTETHPINPDELVKIKNLTMDATDSTSFKVCNESLKKKLKTIKGTPLIEIIEHSVITNLEKGEMTITYTCSVKVNKAQADKVREKVESVVDGIKNLVDGLKSKAQAKIEEIDEVIENEVERGFEKGDQFAEKANEKLKAAKVKINEAKESFNDSAEKVLDEAGKVLDDTFRPGGIYDTTMEQAFGKGGVMDKTFGEGGTFDKVFGNEGVFGKVFRKKSESTKSDQPKKDVSSETSKSNAVAIKRRGRKPGSKNKPKVKES